MYFVCSAVSLSMVMPIDASFSVETYCSISTGTLCTWLPQLALVLDAEFGRQRLRGEAHVHDARRVALRHRQVHQPALPEHVDAAGRSSA